MGKYYLLSKLDADAPELQITLAKLEPMYRSSPTLVGYEPPKVKDVRAALQMVSHARTELMHRVVVQTEMGDVELSGRPETPDSKDTGAVRFNTNTLRETLKVRSPDMLGKAQWTVMRGGRQTRVEILHEQWLTQYQLREVALAPGDSLDCTFQETVSYDAQNNELDRKISIIEVHAIVVPPYQASLSLLRS